MPHQTLKIVPGVDTNKTPTLNEVAVSYTDLVRFMPDRDGLGLVQKLGGWTRFISSSFSAPIRALKAWSDLEYTKYLAIGGESDVGAQVFRQTDNSLLDVTPRILQQDGASSVYTASSALSNPLPKPPVRVATTANLTATYANGTAGLGATLTNSGTLAALQIDGVALSALDRVLVKDQTTGLQNGVYEVTTVGSGAVAWVLTRATDFDLSAEILFGSLFFVSSGTINANMSYYCSNTTAVTVGTTAITFVFSGMLNTTIPLDGVLAASTANFSATYSNGTLGFGATLTSSAPFAPFRLDGVPISSISRSTNVVTVTCSSPHGKTFPSNVVISCVSSSAFNGEFAITSIVSPTVFTYSQVAGDATSSGGYIDGVSSFVAGTTRVLIKDQTNQAHNGIYVVTTIGSSGAAWVLTRAIDFDVSADITLGDLVFVSSGNLNANEYYYCTNSSAVTVGTTAITFAIGAGFTTASNSSALTFYTPLIPSSASYIFFPTIVNVGNINLLGPYDIVTIGSGLMTINVPEIQTFISKITAVTAGSNRTVTVRFANPHSFYAGQPIYVGGVDTATFNGSFTIASVTDVTITYTQTGVATAATSYGGSVTPRVIFGGLPPKFTIASGTTVTVDLINHGYAVGDTFNAPILTIVNGTEVFGLYTVNRVNTADQFEITVSIPASPFATLSASGTGSIATLAITPNYVIPVGTSIVVSGVTPSGYNGTFTVTASSAGLVSYANATTGSQTVAGAVTMPSTVYENSGQIRSEAFVSVVSADQGDNFVYGGGIYNEGLYGSGFVEASTDGTPITAVDWTFDNWGSILVACPKNGATYYWQPVGSSVQNLSYMPNSPVYNAGAFVAMPQRQVIAYGSSFGSIQDPLLVRWCDLEDFTVWQGTAFNQAGSYRIPTGSKIVGGLQAPQQALLWTDLDLWSMTYIGQPYIYGFNKIGANAGLISQKAAGQMSGAVYWMSQRQFFRFAGQGVEPIPCPVWDQVFQNLFPGNDENGNPYTDRIRCAPNSQFNEITWHFPAHYTYDIDPATGLNLSQMQIGTGEVNAYVKYNIALNQWDYGYQHPDNPAVLVGRTAWIDQSIFGGPIGAAAATSVVGETSGFFVYQHETSNNADGAAMEAGFTTGYANLADGDNMIFIDQVWPDMKWGFVDEEKTAQVKITFFVTNYPGDPPIEYGPYTVTQNTQYLSVRMRGRLVAIGVSSTDLNSFWRLGAVRYRYQPDGRY